jgi:ketosteroid isomerase-like protein
MGHVETVQAMYEAFGAGGVAAVLDRLADGVEWDRDAPGYGIPIFEPGTGKEHAAGFFEALARDVEFLRFEPTSFLSGGDQVAVPIHVELRIRSTGKVVTALEVHLWTFDEDGKVSRFFHAIDRHAFVLAYGL